MRFILKRPQAFRYNEIVEKSLSLKQGVFCLLIWRNRDKPFARCRPGEDLKPSCPCPILFGKGDVVTDEIREMDAALLSAIKSLIEILLSEKTTKEDNIARQFEGLYKGYVDRKMYVAAGIMKHLHDYALDPLRQERRQQEISLFDDSPKGSA
jgi:hypothetical protein